MAEIDFVDTTFRDGHASLWAEGMRTGMMLAVAPQVDQIGLKAAEVIATSHFKKCVRELREDPWERIRLVAKKMAKTPLVAMTQGNLNPFTVTPSSVSRLWFERLAANGIKAVQMMDPSNDMGSRLAERVRFARGVGLKVTMALVYSLSPKHTDEYYARKAQEAVGLGVDAVYLKDPGGLLTPDRLQTLIPAIVNNISGLPFELHSHCTTGMAPVVYVEAIRLGVKTLHTAIPPLANGPSQPSLLNVARNARVLGYPLAIDENAVRFVADVLTNIAKREGLPLGAPVEYEYDQYLHQVPGGVISNLRHQLSQLRMEHRLDEVLEEVIRVRRDLGYPIMVTPFSQFVVTQAAMNVMLGERYREVPDEVIQYALGFWGEEASSSIDPGVKDKILARPRARELSHWEIPEPSIEEVRQKLGGAGVSDDELLLRYVVGEKEIEAMRAAGPVKEYSIEAPLLSLIREVAGRRDCTRIYIEKKGSFSLTLQKHHAKGRQAFQTPEMAANRRGVQ